MLKLARQLWMLVVASVVASADTTSMQTHSQPRVSPIRKVVNLLTQMQAELEAEGIKHEAAYKKFACNAKTIIAGLEKAIQDGEERSPQLESSIKQGTAERQQLRDEVTQLKEDLAQCRHTLTTATALREKEAKEIENEVNVHRANIAAIIKAVAAIEKGRGGGEFLQSRASTILSRLSISSEFDLSSVDRELLSNFLGGKEPEHDSGVVVGILKQMRSRMEEDLAEMLATEKKAIAEYNSMLGAKNKEIKATTKSIEVKTGRKGVLAVKLSSLTKDLDDIQNSLKENSKLLADTRKALEFKTKEHESLKEIQARELVILADTVKLLNIVSGGLKKISSNSQESSFIQLRAARTHQQHRALRLVHQARIRAKRQGRIDPHLDLLELALRGRRGTKFKAVVEKMDKLIANLKREQSAEAEKRAWCMKEQAKTEGEAALNSKVLSNTKKDLANTQEDLNAILKEIAIVSGRLKELDALVARTTQQRKEESESNKHTVMESGAAKELLQIARSRLQKFYKNKGAKPKPKSSSPLNDEDLADQHADTQETKPANLDDGRASISKQHDHGHFDQDRLDDGSTNTSHQRDDGHFDQETHEAGNPWAETGEEATEAGSPLAEKDEEATEAGSPLAETGEEAPEAGRPLAEKGEEAPEAGSPWAEHGEEASEAGSPLAEKGEEASQTGSPWAENGEEAPEGGSPWAENGKASALDQQGASVPNGQTSEGPQTTEPSSEMLPDEYGDDFVFLAERPQVEDINQNIDEFIELGAHVKKREKPKGVIDKLDELKEDLDIKIEEINAEEKEAQAEYETFMSDCSAKRSIDSKALANKETAKAEVEAELQKLKAKFQSGQDRQREIQRELKDLRADCGVLQQNFHARRKAFEGEIDALTKAKAVVAGADLS